MKNVGDPCPYCNRPITAKFVRLRDMSKISNARESIIKAKARGTIWKRRADYDLILQLRNAGLSIRKIAFQTKYSPATVHRALKIIAKETI